MLGRAWELLKCTAFRSLPRHCSCATAAAGAQLGPFTVRFDAMRRPTPWSNRPGIHLVCVCQTSHCSRIESITGERRMFLVAAAPEWTAWPGDIDIPADRGVGLRFDCWKKNINRKKTLLIWKQNRKSLNLSWNTFGLAKWFLFVVFSMLAMFVTK